MTGLLSPAPPGSCARAVSVTATVTTAILLLGALALACVFSPFVGGASVLADFLPGCPDSMPLGLDWELRRLLFAVLPILALAVWLTGRAWAAARTWRAPGFLAGIAVFSALLLVSALHAADRRAALTVWWEQSALLVAAWLSLQLFAGTQAFRRLLLFCTLLGVTLALWACADVFVTNPAVGRELAQNRVQVLARLGLADDTPAARLYEARVRDGAAAGPLFSPNLLAAACLPLLGAAVALALWACRRPAPVRRPWAGRGLALGAVGVIVLGLCLTRSRGALASAFLITFVGLAWAAFPRRRRALILGLVLAGLAGGGWFVGQGWGHGSFTDPSLTVRWQYWSTAMRLTAASPITGSGPGNFAGAYAAARPAAAEETVFLPHSFAVSALAQYGLPAGCLFIGLVVLAVVVPWRRTARPDPADLDASADVARLRLPLAAAVAAAAVAALLENGLEFPGPALVFWVTAGAAAAPVFPSRGVGPRVLAGLAILSAAGVSAALVLLVRPVAARTQALRSAATALAGGRAPQALADLGRAAAVDTLAPLPPAETAQLLVWAAPRTPTEAMRRSLLLARQWGLTAAQRNPRDADSQLLLARIAWYLADADELALERRRQGGALAARAERLGWMAEPDAAALAARAAAAFVSGARTEALSLARQAAACQPHSAVLESDLGDAAWCAGNADEARAAWQRAAQRHCPGRFWNEALSRLRAAVALAPADASLRLELARLYAVVGRPAACLEAVSAARRIDASRPPQSLRRLPAGQQADLTLLAARATSLLRRQ